MQLEVAYIPQSPHPCPVQCDTGCTSPATVASDLSHTPRDTVLEAASKALLVTAEVKGQGQGQGQDSGEGASVELVTDSGKDSQATDRTPHSDCTFRSSMVDSKAVTRVDNYIHEREASEFGFEGLGDDESQKGYFDNFDNAEEGEGEGADNQEDWEEEEQSLDPSVFLSPFIFTGKKNAVGDWKEEMPDGEKKLHNSSEVEAAYLALYAHMESVSSGAIFTPACQDVTFGDEEVSAEEEEEEGEEVEETGEGIVQWIDVGDDVVVDEGEQSDSSGEGTPADAMPPALDLETLSVRLSSRSEEDKTHSKKSQSIPDEILLFGPIIGAASPRSALNSHDKDDVTTSTETPSEGLPKRAWVSKTVDFALVVEDLQVALTAGEMRTINRKEILRETSRKVAEADVLRRSLQAALGTEAFSDASYFLRTVATMQIEESNAEEDEYLLSQMEDIVGAEGLQYMEDIFSLITMEDDIHRDETYANKIDQDQDQEKGKGQEQGLWQRQEKKHTVDQES